MQSVHRGSGKGVQSVHRGSGKGEAWCNRCTGFPERGRHGAIGSHEFQKGFSSTLIHIISLDDSCRAKKIYFNESLCILAIYREKLFSILGWYPDPFIHDIYIHVPSNHILVNLFIK